MLPVRENERCVCVEPCCQSLPCFTGRPLCTVIRAVDSDVMTWGETTAGEVREREGERAGGRERQSEGQWGIRDKVSMGEVRQRLREREKTLKTAAERLRSGG